ncbi:hypothetical protein Kpol_1062p50 [Vanderwaltozyma polyspora DSM 70294]|uniref:Uncharacterized protein n=1 Tax=Vanderwaltozyma polyspora (strain ATCC 22028 / DSM 70294 / BCRC 21397 / CBS 2163 / NBRC 10782 / NRRL Y-8283 / UCD 57-17) TaxID=436907 RepID=A7TKA5_VANPO|nr:uncharacterized protein Kpol_1062p50 [Vanderwaltozyma polyspora DSM 70294]EDO17340.1 hypothetical protein Kpol_1062p50 [Vanderwaltozyma polyspora DSM 70294]
MSSEQLTEQHLSGALITSHLTLQQFKDLISDTGIESESLDGNVESWYQHLMERDSHLRENISKEVRSFISRTKETQIKELEDLQSSKTFTLEELINHLYSIDQILNIKLKNLDDEISENTVKFKKLNDMILQSNNDTSDGNSSADITDTLETIKKYKSMISNDIDDPI